MTVIADRVKWPNSLGVNSLGVKTDLEVFPQKLLNRSDPERDGPTGPTPSGQSV